MSATLNPAQDYRRRLIRRELDVGTNARVVDIGCGQGDQAAELLAHWPTAEVLGIDLSASGLRAAREKVPDATFLEHDLTKPLQPQTRFRGWATHAICSEVLEHMESPEALLQHVKPLLAPGCRLIVTVPGGPRSKFDLHIGHRKHYRPREVRDLLESTGYDVEKVTGAGFPFFNLYRLTVLARGQKLVDDVAGNPTELSSTARIVMRIFAALFRGNIATGSLGWQIIGVARVPSTP